VIDPYQALCAFAAREGFEFFDLENAFTALSRSNSSELALRFTL
jgi:hypothetical protein